MVGVKRISFDFPADEFPYLKLLCAEKGTTIRELGTRLFLEEIRKFKEEQKGKNDE